MRGFAIAVAVFSLILVGRSAFAAEIDFQVVGLTTVGHGLRSDQASYLAYNAREAHQSISFSASTDTSFGSSKSVEPAVSVDPISVDSVVSVSDDGGGDASAIPLPAGWVLAVSGLSGLMIAQWLRSAGRRSANA
jgi:hypothetical protein